MSDTVRFDGRDEPKVHVETYNPDMDASNHYAVCVRLGAFAVHGWCGWRELDETIADMYTKLCRDIMEWNRNG